MGAPTRKSAPHAGSGPLPCAARNWRGFQSIHRRGLKPAPVAAHAPLRPAAFNGCGAFMFRRLHESGAFVRGRPGARVFWAFPAIPCHGPELAGATGRSSPPPLPHALFQGSVAENALNLRNSGQDSRKALWRPGQRPVAMRTFRAVSVGPEHRAPYLEARPALVRSKWALRATFFRKPRPVRSSGHPQPQPLSGAGFRECAAPMPIPRGLPAMLAGNARATAPRNGTFIRVRCMARRRATRRFPDKRPRHGRCAHPSVIHHHDLPGRAVAFHQRVGLGDVAQGKGRRRSD